MKRISNFLLIFAVSFTGLTACSLMERSSVSGYSTYDYERPWNSEQLAAEKDAYEKSRVREELGWANSRPLNEVEARALEERISLNRMETRLETDREKKQYYRYKGLMLNDQERAQFLKIPTVEARERWAANRGYNQSEDGHSDQIAALIEKNDVTVGMSQKAVIESWGDPDLVEVAGNAVYGNERWRYSKYVSSNEGYQKVDKFLYFEAGRLVGWETD